MHLPPEGLTVAVSAIGVVMLLAIFFLVKRFRRIRDESVTWDDPVFCTWRCQECELEGIIVANSFADAKAEAPYRHDQLFSPNAPVLLAAVRVPTNHHILVTQES